MIWRLQLYCSLYIRDVALQLYCSICIHDVAFAVVLLLFVFVMWCLQLYCSFLNSCCDICSCIGAFVFVLWRLQLYLSLCNSVAAFASFSVFGYAVCSIRLVNRSPLLTDYIRKYFKGSEHFIHIIDSC